jgi:uracil-DNA glycosylase
MSIDIHSLETAWPLRFWDKEWPNIAKQLDYKRLGGSIIYPNERDIFKALELTPLDRTKVIIIGQDPYHTKGAANGLAFSVYPHYKPLPPSLRNILTELSTDLGYDMPRTGDLRGWADQGVLLLNRHLTVEEGKPLSHQHLGWDRLTYEITRRLSGLPRNLVWIMWGSQAQEFAGAVDTRKDCLIQSAHPSPFSARKGFIGSKPFSRANEFLEEMGETPINWRIR